MDREAAAYTETTSVRAMLDAATCFGLTREEAWRTFSEALSGTLAEMTAAEYLDEIAGALAAEILAKQRRILRERLD